MSPGRGLSGMAAVMPEAARRLQEMAARASAILEQSGFGRIEVPIIEPIEPFLLRYGEQVRGSMYVFTDPGGKEVCLRPEMTIPVIRAVAPRLSRHAGPIKVYYDGPVFRHWPADQARPRQERQFGAELMGSDDQLDADSRIIALAYKVGRGVCGGDVRIVLNDLSIFSAAIEAMGVPERAGERLLETVGTPGSLSSGSVAGRKSRRGPDEDLAGGLADLGRDQGIKLLKAMLSRMPMQQLGARSSDEIAERFWDRLIEAGAEQETDTALKELRKLSSVAGPARIAIDRLRKRFKGRREAINKFARLATAAVKQGVPEDRLVIDLGLARPFSYYSGVIFEIRAGGRTLGGGGRYDRLVRLIDPRLKIDAVGFAMSLDEALKAEAAESKL